MSRKYVCVADEEYVLDPSEAFSQSCMVVISFHFKVLGVLVKNMNVNI